VMLVMEVDWYLLYNTFYRRNHEFNVSNNGVTSGPWQLHAGFR